MKRTEIILSIPFWCIPKLSLYNYFVINPFVLWLSKVYIFSYNYKVFTKLIFQFTKLEIVNIFLKHGKVIVSG